MQTYLSASIPDFDNSLEVGYITFIKHINWPKKIHKEVDLSKLRHKYISKLETCLSDLKLDNIYYKVLDKDIDISSSEDLNIEEGADFGEVAYSTFIAFSVVVEIKVK